MARCYVTYCRVYEGCQRPWPVLHCSLDCVKPNLLGHTSFVCRSEDFFKSLKGLPVEFHKLTMMGDSSTVSGCSGPIHTLFDYSNLNCDVFCSSFTQNLPFEQHSLMLP
jgi:hypothetical protein